MIAGIARIGLAMFVVTVVVLHLLCPEIDPVAQGISYYALGKLGWLFTVSCLFLGFGTLAVICALWRRCTTRSGSIGIALLFVWTAMLEVGAFFAIDAPGDAPTFSGRIHGLAGSGFLLLPASALLIEKSLSNTAQHRAIRKPGLILAYGVVAASILLVVFNGFLVSYGVDGMVQRAYWVTIVSCLFFLAGPQANLALEPETASSDDGVRRHSNR
jgi:hypothetical protein